MGIFYILLSYFRNENPNENLDENPDENSIFYLNGENLLSSEFEGKDINFLQIKRNRTNNNLDENDENINNNKRKKIENVIEIMNRLDDLELRLRNIENNFINNNIYSYQVIDPDLRHIIKCPKGVQSLIIDLVLKNNGNINWPENSTKLRIDRNDTNFKTNFTEVNLGFLGVGQQKKFKMVVDIVGKLVENKYRLALDFCVNNGIFGDKIYINFQVIDDKISDMRALYEIPKSMATDTCIGKELKNNKGNYAQAFNNIIYRSVNNTKENQNNKKN